MYRGTAGAGRTGEPGWGARNTAGGTVSYQADFKSIHSENGNNSDLRNRTIGNGIRFDNDIARRYRTVCVA
jgi:hypothetical protein